MWEFAIRGYSDEELEKSLAHNISRNDHEGIKIIEKEKARRIKNVSTKEESLWRKTERPVYSRFWRAVHNVVAHPLLALYRPLGLRIHEYTANKMYKDNGKKPINVEAN